MSYEEERIKFENIKVGVKEKQLEAKLQRKTAHKEFVKKHKKLLLIMDIFVITIVLANFGAVFITNAMVTRANPETELKEANPVQAELNDYEVHPEGKVVMNMLMIQTFMWTILIFGYILTRINLYTTKELLVIGFILVFYVYLIYFDFINDLGYWVGKILGGG